MGQKFDVITSVAVDDVMPVRYFYPNTVIIVCLRVKFFKPYKKYCPLGGINKDLVSYFVSISVRPTVVC